MPKKVKYLAQEKGMTLIEIMVVLAIMGGLMLLLLGKGLLKSNSARLREASVEVQITLKAAYNLAAMSGRHHRVMFDLEKQVYHIEVCSGRQTLQKGDEEEQADEEGLKRLREKLENPISNVLDAEILKSSSPEKAAEKAAALEGIKVGSTRCKPTPSLMSGQVAKGGNLHTLDTKRGLKIKRIYVQHLNDAVDEKTVSINFFPVGSAEKAVVELENSDGDEFSILLHGLTSRTEFRVGKIDVDEHMHKDGAGDDAKEH